LDFQDGGFGGNGIGDPVFAGRRGDGTRPAGDTNADTTKKGAAQQETH